MSPASPSHAPRILGAAPAPLDAAPVGTPTRYLDEDLSWLDAWGRLLARAEADSLQLLDRVRLLAASGRALDGFFQLRGPGLRARSAGGSDRGQGVRMRAQEFSQRQDRLLRRVRPLLADAGVRVWSWEALGEEQRRSLARVFGQRLLPVLAPLATEPGQPCPVPANLTLSFAVDIGDGPLPVDGARRLGWLELPPVLPRFLPLPDGGFVPLEEVVAAHLPVLFAGHPVQGHALFRVTRQGGVPTAADSEDLLSSVERQLRQERHGVPVRLEVEPHMAAGVRDRLVAELDLSLREVYTVGGLLGPADLGAVAAVDRPPLKSPATPSGPSGWRPVTEPRLQAAGADPPDLFRVLDGGDVLVHSPYDSFTGSADLLLAQAARDRRVLAVKQILYRPSPDAPIVRSLLRAAERGTHVVVLVELAARLAERESVACARALEKAGAHVVYGLLGLRTHCPVTLLVRQSDDGVRRYAMLSTGPHHPETSPEAMCLLSAEPDLAADLADLFNYLTGYSRPSSFRQLLVAPGGLRAHLLELIRREAAAGAGGRISVKVGRLVDREMIDTLYAASGRGVQIEAVVSGACALRPGVAGLSENIRVVAGAGTRSESSRLFGFGSGEDRRWYVSSADLAVRNLDRQVDVAVPIGDGGLRARLEETFQTLLSHHSWDLGPDGAWRPGPGGAGAELRRLATLRAAPAPRASLRL